MEKCSCLSPLDEVSDFFGRRFRLRKLCLRVKRERKTAAWNGGCLATRRQGALLEYRGLERHDERDV